MTQKRLLRLATIVNYFSDDQTQIEKGEHEIQLNNVRVHFNALAGEVIGYVLSSSKSEQYRVKLLLDEQRDIRKAECSCSNGEKTTCSHTAAVALFAHYNIPDNFSTPPDIEVKLKQPEVNAINYYILPTKDSHVRYRKFLGFPKYSRSWSVSTSKENGPLSIPNIQSLILRDEFRCNYDKKKFFEEQCSVTESIITYIANTTIGQADNTRWSMYRRYRLIDSHFGAIIRAWRKHEYPASLFEKLTGTHILEKSEAIKWRKDHHAESIESFTLVTGLHVLPTGLWLHPCGYLCASPDGFVADNAIVEIKHPFNCRFSNLQIFLSNDYSYICRYDQLLNKFIVNEEHDYYHQAQGQLHILNKQICYLVIWAPNQIIVMDIERSPRWAHYIAILKEFYLTHFLKYIT